MRFNNETRSLYLETDADVAVKAGLLHIKNELNCPDIEVPHNSIKRLAAFASRSLSTVKRYSNMEREALEM